MKLFLSIRSPFARRVRLALRRLHVPHTEVIMDVFNPPQDFYKQQPLGTIPYIEIAPGEFLPDSQTILEYLDQLESGVLPNLVSRRSISTYSVGVMTATVAWFLESQRAAPLMEFLDEQKETITRAMAQLEKIYQEKGPDLAFWDLAVAIEYLAFRMPELNWDKKWPGLVSVLEAARQNKDFADTKPRLQ